jgi:hypothetical protein
MKNIISYVLWGTEGRYWANIPYILIVNSQVYPKFCSRFYIHQESNNLPIFKLLEEVKILFPDLIEIEIINKTYEGTELTTWRMKPLWENNVDVLLCRDLDHVTNELERKSVEFFLRCSTKPIHGIRSYHLHTTPLLAGLCGFKCEQLRRELKDFAYSFQDYIEWGKKNVDYCKQGWIWGCDQALLRDFFNNAQLYSKIVDCPQLTAPKAITSFSAVAINEWKYRNISIHNCNMDVLELSNSFAPGFTGAPCNPTTDQVKKMIELVDNDLTKVVSKYV